jgi:bifunctional non-homologous end joining protein LigD
MPKRSLSTYRAKRDFSSTPEPRTGGKAGGRLFVVQHHWATREHYDFRLELDGVLLSWAVTRGPSFDSADKRLAVRTEDHPLSYAEFEGMIPEGNYGAGTVMLWDIGTWEPAVSDPRKALAEGSLKFRLDGERMKGGWALIRMKGSEKRENWLLIKERDEYVLKGFSIDRFSTSVSTGRTRGQIEKGLPSKKKRPSAEKPNASRKSADFALPAFIPPMLCELHKEPPPGAGWLHETKYDGYRLEAAVHGEHVRLYTREGLDWTDRFPSIAAAFAKLGLKRTLLDGEAVVFDKAGLTDFAALVEALKNKSHQISFVIFDILVDRGKDVRLKSLTARKAQLEEALAKKVDGHILTLSSHIEADGPLVFEKAAALGAEGIVSKKASSIYESRRSPNWIKVKTARREDFVVIGYKPSERRQFSSLLVAVETPGGLKYVGAVGAGFGGDELHKTYRLLQSLLRKSPPPVGGLEKAPRNSRWVESVLRAEIEFQGWTSDHQLRQARFLGWREDRQVERAKLMTKRAATQKNSAKVPERAGAARSLQLGRSSKTRKVPASITHADRIVYPDAGFTKGDVAAYYLAVADRMMPHLKDRPISFVRAPEGLAGEIFFQRHPLPGMAAGIRRIPDPEGKHKEYIAIASEEGFTTAAQFGVIEFHGWGAKWPKLHGPDRVVLDLDPDPAVEFAAVRQAAFELKDLLKAIDLESFPLVTGGKGIHVVLPLDATQDWDTITDFASGLARGLAAADPQRFIATASKEKRKGRIYVDWLRNRLTASAILPWSLRAKPNASVAMPVSWRELRNIDRADLFTLKTAPARKDAWPNFFATKQRINKRVLAYFKSKMAEHASLEKMRTGKA